MYCQCVFEGNPLAVHVKWLSDRIAEERVIVEDALVRSEIRIEIKKEKQTARGSSKEITMAKAVVQQ